jgi:hypothetical protein
MEIILVEQRIPKMQFLENHLILGECASLVSQEVLDPAQLFGDGGRPHHGAFNLLVTLYTPGVERFANLQVHSHTTMFLQVLYLSEAQNRTVPASRG